MAGTKAALNGYDVTGERPPERRTARSKRRRAVAAPSLTDRILDFPYRKLFGPRGRLVIASAVVLLLAVKFVTGIQSVTLDPLTCELAWVDRVYEPLHEQRILANTRREFSDLLAEKQKALWAIQAGRNPLPAAAEGNVAGGERRINKDKFFWRTYAANLEKERVAISACLRRLPTYRFD